MPKRPWHVHSHVMLCIPNITNMSTILRYIAISCISKSCLNHIQNVKTTLMHSRNKPYAASPESLRCSLRPTCGHVATLVAVRGKNLREHLPPRRPEIWSSANHGETSLLLKSRETYQISSFWKKTGMKHIKTSAKITTCCNWVWKYADRRHVKKIKIPLCYTVSPGYSFVRPWSSKLHW